MLSLCSAVLACAHHSTPCLALHSFPMPLFVSAGKIGRRQGRRQRRQRRKASDDWKDCVHHPWPHERVHRHVPRSHDDACEGDLSPGPLSQHPLSFRPVLVPIPARGPVAAPKVELHAKHKIETLPITSVKEVGDAGGRSDRSRTLAEAPLDYMATPSLVNATPLISAATPMHGQTPMYGGMTPIHGTTPMRGGASPVSLLAPLRPLCVSPEPLTSPGTLWGRTFGGHVWSSP